MRLASRSMHVRLRRQHRLVCTAPRPAAVAVLAEGRVDQRLQHLQQRLLDQPVDHGRYPQLARSATRFRQAHPAHRFWLVRAIEQPLADVGPRLLEVFGRVLHRAPIDAGASLVGLDAFPRPHNVLSGQRLPQQVVGPPARLSVSRQRCFIARGFLAGFTAPATARPGLPCGFAGF